MSKLERITVTMTEGMVAKLRAAVDAGEYATTSEIVREALRDWEESQIRRKARLDHLSELIEEARKGPFLDGPAAMRELRERYAARAAKNG